MADKEHWSSLRLPQEVDRLFNELIHRPWGFSRTLDEWNPQLDLYETAQAFVLEADLPGVQEKDVTVRVENRDLVLEGSRALEQVQTTGNFYCRERRAGHFLRRFRLPNSVDEAQIRATFQDGVLRVTLPKLRPEPA